MVGWLFWLGHVFEPLGQAVRWPGVILGHMTIFVWIELLKYLQFETKKISLWVWLALSSPFLGLGSIIITPDLPVVFFWSLSLLLAYRIAATANLIYYVLLGASLGLGFCSKYHIVLFVPALLIYLLIDSSYKKIKLTGASLTLVFGLIFSAPVLIWNYQNNFSSFKFQINHGLGEASWSPSWTIGYLLGQFIILFPTTFWAGIRAYKNYFLSVFAFFPLLFFLVSSLRGAVEVNWPIIAYPSYFALAATSMVSEKILRISVYFWGFITVYVVYISIFPIAGLVPEKLAEIRYFDPILIEAQTHDPLYLGSYQMASIFSYKLKKPFDKLYQINRHDLFDEISIGAPKEKKFFFIKETWVENPPWLVPNSYKINKIKDLPPKFELYEVTRND